MNNILSCLDTAKNVLIVGHIRPDGDCVGSCMGLWHYIRDNYPDIDVDIRLEPISDGYKVIKGTENIISTYDDDKIYDLFISLDASDLGRLGQAIKYFETATHRICIDHHISNPGFADENHILPHASSASEVLTDLLDMDKISYDAAYALYVGIICDTGVFKYTNTSRHTMDVAGALMEKGIPYTKIIDGVFYRKTFMQNQLLGQVLLNAQLRLEGKVIVSIIDKALLDRFGATHNDLEGIIDQMRVTDGVEVAVLISETVDKGYKFSLRSKDIVDVSKVCETFGGGGHIRASGCSIDADAWEAYLKIESLIKEQL